MCAQGCSRPKHCMTVERERVGYEREGEREREGVGKLVGMAKF